MRVLPPLALALAALALAPGLAAASAQAGDASLEALLRRARAERERVREELRPEVASLVARVEADPDQAARVVEQLVALGPAAAPLLVPHLDPGDPSTEEARRRALAVLAALERLPSPAATDPLVATAREGSPGGRELALRALGASPDVERALACLAEAFEGTTGRLRGAAVAGLARLGGAQSRELLVRALADEDPDVLRDVLAALAGTPSPETRARVAELTADPARAARVVDELLVFWRAQDDLAADEAAALVALAASDAPAKEARVALLDTLPALGAALDARLRKAFDPLLEASDDEVREAAQVALALLGDRNERRALQRRYDELVEQNEDWWGAYRQRGRMQLRLGEHRAAAKDFERAVELLQDRGRSVSQIAPELWVELARAHSLDGKARQAHDALASARLGRDELALLAEDPDFATLRGHSRYGRIFPESR